MDSEEIFEIRIQGHLQDRRAGQFAGMTLTRESGGTTLLRGPLPDQAALHSVLLRLGNMNLKLISVNQIDRDLEEESRVEREDEGSRTGSVRRFDLQTHSRKEG